MRAGADGFADYYASRLPQWNAFVMAMPAAIDAFSPVARNAGEISRMARLNEEAMAITDNWMQRSENAAAGRGFAAGAAR
jgi:Na+/H+-translocating membrane pyrophosphatase